MEWKMLSGEISIYEPPVDIQNEDFPAKEIQHTSENEIEHDFGDYYCSKCKFKTYSNTELKHNIIRKHTEYKTSYPWNCELCENSFENGLQLKTRLKEHSLEETLVGQYSYKDLRFLGDDFVKMEVHSGKCSVRDFECEPDKRKCVAVWPLAAEISLDCRNFQVAALSLFSYVPIKDEKLWKF